MSWRDEVYKYVNSLQKKPYFAVMIKTLDTFQENGTLFSEYSYINFLKCIKELKRNLDNKFFETPKIINFRNYSDVTSTLSLYDLDNFNYGAILFSKISSGEELIECRYFVKK